MSRGARAGVARSRDPLAGCDREVGHGRVQGRPDARLWGQITEGPSSALRRAPLAGMRPANATSRRRDYACSTATLSEAAA